MSKKKAFSLIELLVVVAIIALLAGLLLSALSKAKSAASSARCLSNLRQVGLAARFYADENNDEMPRSQHSAFAHRQLTWGRAIAPELGVSGAMWTNLLQTVYRCPGNKRLGPWSYGLNVYFELGPEDDYIGKPKIWRKTTSIPYPTRTIQFAESSTGADHIMAHFWITPSEVPDVDSGRHGKRSNYGFVDGHVEALKLETTFEPTKEVDYWNPANKK